MNRRNLLKMLGLGSLASVLPLQFAGAAETNQSNEDYNRKLNTQQQLMQLYDKGLISAHTLLGYFDLDYDKEVERMRQEQKIQQA